MRMFVLTASATSLLLAFGCQERTHRHAQTTTAPAAPVVAASAGGIQTADLKISGVDYLPAAIIVQPGVPLRLNVTRDDKPGCGEVLSIPSQNIKRDIPLGQVTTIEFTPQQAGKIEFTCGMNMMRGSIVVREPGA